MTTLGYLFTLRIKDAMPAGRFLDSLDTVRDHRAGHLPHISTGQMMVHLLCNQEIRLSQTHGFDSSFLLEHAGDPHFRRLMQRGHVQVLLFKTPTLLDAFRRALKKGVESTRINPTADDDGLFKFSAWSVLENGSRQEKVALRRDALKQIAHAERNKGRLPAGAAEEFKDSFDKLWALHVNLLNARHKWKRTDGKPFTRLRAHRSSAYRPSLKELGLSSLSHSLA